MNYTIDGFTDKNRDRIFDNLYSLIASSSSPFISSLFPQLANQGKTTVCAKFQKQLNDLVCILEASERKYIRCIHLNKYLPVLYSFMNSYVIVVFLKLLRFVSLVIHSVLPLIKLFFQFLILFLVYSSISLLTHGEVNSITITRFYKSINKLYYRFTS